jgi:hypothetical protein
LNPFTLDLTQRRPDLGIDFGNIMLSQMQQPRRDPRRHCQHSRLDRPKHAAQAGAP